MRKIFNEVDFEGDDIRLLPVSVSNKHVHLRPEQIEVLFGEGYLLKIKKMLSQPGQFAAQETVHVVGPKGILKNVRIVGPARRYTQVELAQTDAIKLGLNAPRRNSGDIARTASCVLVGPNGYVLLNEGALVAKSHVHLSRTQGEELQIADNDLVDLYFNGEKQAVFYNITARVGLSHEKDIHLDTDEANALALKPDQKALVIKSETPGDTP